MESLKDFKDWILKKRYSPESNDTRNTLHAGITPNSIPEFVIPGSVEAMRSDNTECYEGGPSYRMSQKRNSIATSSPKHTGHVPLPRTQSDQMSLNEDVKFTLLYRDKTRSLGYLESLPRQTNADPLSKAAVSLPHFRSKTSYGFTTLNQPPHTKRKESLFHSGCNGFISNEDLTRLLVIESLKQKCKSSENFTNVCVENTSTPTVVVSAPALADNSLNRETVCTSHLSPPKPNYQRKRKGKTEHYFRRRSSLLGTDCSSVSSEDSIIHELEFEGQLTPSPSGSLRLEGSTPSFQLEESILSQVSTGRCHAESGEIKFAFQFLAASKMFKVTIIRAENLGGVNRIDPCINSYCKVCLTPGKYQRQTNIVKQNKNPIYNQELAFNSLSLKQLHLMLLDIKIFHKERYQKHPEYLGKISVNLENYDLMTENRMWKEIDSKREREVRLSNSLGGHIHAILKLGRVNYSQFSKELNPC